MNHLRNYAGAAALTLVGLSAEAATLTVTPSATQIDVGSTLQVSITISDLIAGAAPALGAFDITVQFNPTVLSYSGISWGDSVLGDQLDLEQLGSWTEADISQAAGGTLNYFEISYDSANTLESLQAGNFDLLTLSFSAIGIGNSPITLGINALSNAEGNELEAQISNADITAVPLPATLPLFATALMILGGRIRRCVG